MSLKKKLGIIGKYAKERICDGSCVDYRISDMCPECYAREFLNDLERKARDTIKILRRKERDQSATENK